LLINSASARRYKGMPFETLIPKVYPVHLSGDLSGDDFGDCCCNIRQGDKSFEDTSPCERARPANHEGDYIPDTYGRRTTNGAEWIDGVLTYPPTDDPAWWENVPEMKWLGSVEMLPWKYLCGYCGNRVSSVRGMVAVSGGLVSSLPVAAQYVQMAAYICPHCGGVTFTCEGLTMPRPKYGDEVSNLPEKVEAIYGEARRSMQAGAYTGVIGLCRTLLSHVAAEEGAPKGTFNQNVQWLEAEGHIPKKAKPGLGAPATRALDPFGPPRIPRRLEGPRFVREVDDRFEKSGGSLEHRFIKP
jgi:hypothetical protein